MSILAFIYDKLLKSGHHQRFFRAKGAEVATAKD